MGSNPFKGLNDDLFADAIGETPDSPRIFSRGLSAVGSVLGAPKSALDYLSRKSAETLFDIPDTGATPGQMLRAGLDLDPSNTDSYAGRLTGKATEFLGDLGTDPLLPVGFGSGTAGKVATGALTGVMAAGAAQEGLGALERAQDEGFTPEVAEESLGALLGAGGAYLGARHLGKGLAEGRAARAAKAAELAAAEAAQPKPFATTGTDFPLGASPEIGSGLGTPLDFDSIPMGQIQATLPERPPVLRSGSGLMAEAPLDIPMGRVSAMVPDVPPPVVRSGSGMAAQAPLDIPMGQISAMAPERVPETGTRAPDPGIRAADAKEAALIADRITQESDSILRRRLKRYEEALKLESAEAVRTELARRGAEGFRVAEEPRGAAPPPELEPPTPENAPAEQAEPQFAFRSRNIGEKGAPGGEGHAHASMSEADIRRVAPSRTDAPQEVVRVDLSKLDPSDYQVIERGEGEAPWVRFNKPLDEAFFETVGPVTDVDVAAASKAELLPAPQAQAIRSVVDSALGDVDSAAALSSQVKLSPGATLKGVEDIKNDGSREFSPEAVTIKRAILEETAGPAAPGWKAAAPEPVQVGAIAEELGRASRLTPESEISNLTPEAAAPEPTFNPDATQPVPFNPDTTQPYKPLSVLKGRHPEPGNVKPATIHVPETRVPEGAISQKAAEGIPSQVEAIRESGIEDFPLLPKEARTAIFDGEGALNRLKQRGQGKAFDLGSVAAEGAGAIKDLATYGASLIERGIRDFGAWSKEMLANAGQHIANLGEHLKAIFDRARELARSAQDSMVERADKAATERPGELGAFGARKPIKPIPNPPEAKGTNAATIAPPSAKVAATPPPSAKAASGKPKPTLFDQIVEGHKSNLVSAPGTHLVNPASTLGEGTVRSAEAGVAGMIDSLLSRKTGQRTRFSGEALEQIKGGLESFPEATRVLADGIKNVLNTEGAIPGKFGKVARAPLEMLGVEDRATSVISNGASMRGAAFREAKKQLPNGSAADIAARQKQIMANPTPELKEAVRKDVAERQFKPDRDPDSLVKKLTKLRERHKWMHIAPFTFIDTPAAIAELALKRSPAGFWEAGKAYSAYRRAVKAGAPAELIAKLQGEAADKIARPLVGSAVLGAFALVARAGGMTGSGPNDSKQRGLLKETGWQPYSFVVPIGNGKKAYIPFNRFEPVSSLLGFAADMAESGDSKDANDLFTKALGSVAQNLTSKTYLTSLADAAALIKDPEQFAGQYIQNLTGAAVPNIVAKAAQAIDPKVRDTRPDEEGFVGLPERVGKNLVSRIPFASTLLDERRSGTGETIKRPGEGVAGAISRFASPIQVTTTKEGKALEALMAEVGAVPSAPSNELTANRRKIRLTDEEYSLIQDADKKATEALRKLVSTPGFRRLSAEDQKQELESTRQKFRRAAKQKIMATPSFRRRALA